MLDAYHQQYTKKSDIELQKRIDIKRDELAKIKQEINPNFKSEILDIAKSVGFIIDSKIDMVDCQYDSQYIYILQKSN